VPKMLGKVDPNGKYAVFSTTSWTGGESLNFIFLLPLTALAWKRIGFESIIIIVGSVNVWNSDPLLYTVLTSVRQLDAVVIFLDVHPVNTVMISQVRQKSSNLRDFQKSPCEAQYTVSIKKFQFLRATAHGPKRANSHGKSVCPFACHVLVLYPDE